jgi:hypothetical protein
MFLSECGYHIVTGFNRRRYNEPIKSSAMGKTIEQMGDHRLILEWFQHLPWQSPRREACLNDCDDSHELMPLNA